MISFMFHTDRDHCKHQSLILCLSCTKRNFTIFEGETVTLKRGASQKLLININRRGSLELDIDKYKVTKRYDMHFPPLSLNLLALHEACFSTEISPGLRV